MRKIQMMGIDHSRATVAERELFSLTKAKQKELMEAVIRQQKSEKRCVAALKSSHVRIRCARSNFPEIPVAGRPAEGSEGKEK